MQNIWERYLYVQTNREGFNESNINTSDQCARVTWQKTCADTSGWLSVKGGGRPLANASLSLASRQQTARVRCPWLYRYPNRAKQQRSTFDTSGNVSNILSHFIYYSTPTTICLVISSASTIRYNMLLITLCLTKRDGLQVDGIHEMGEQRPL